jgi:hypothetical protein
MTNICRILLYAIYVDKSQREKYPTQKEKKIVNYEIIKMILVIFYIVLL